MHACEGRVRLNGRQSWTQSKPDSLPNIGRPAGSKTAQTRTTRSASVLGHFAVASPVARQIPLELVHIEHPVSTRTRLSLGQNISAPSTPIPTIASSSSSCPLTAAAAAAGAMPRPDANAAYDRCFELFSPDLTQSCLLRGSSRQQTNIWVAAISRQIQMLNQLHLANLRQIMPQNQLRRIGWMMELVCSAESSVSPNDPVSCAASSHSWPNYNRRGTSSSPTLPKDVTSAASVSGAAATTAAAATSPTWKPVFLAVSEDSLLLYHHAPLRLEQWQHPAHSNALIATRVVDAPPLGIAGDKPNAGVRSLFDFMAAADDPFLGLLGQKLIFCQPR
ncbi:unnamed protein product [Schistocephalus solidus]|uniref:PH_17 domain-containing protein n=1 Tax=Schistocephalus solidus TaxID=70667 RepID=A0A183SWV9_SCHSO|nr:unnamed protein product [Schistocephalus solidus]